jgi:transcription initiation factor IIF auxiliary subunit
MVQIEIGNRCEKHGESYRWLVFLKSDSRIIKSASMELHPTFQSRHVHLKQQQGGLNFESQAFRGWGTFKIPVSVELDDGECVEFEHNLSFERPKTSSVVQIDRPQSETTQLTEMTETTQPSETNVQAVPTSFLCPVSVRECASVNQLDGTDESKRADTANCHAKETKGSPGAHSEQEPLPPPPPLKPLLPTLDPADPQMFFGRGYSGELKLPREAWVSDQKPRDDHDAPEWLTATEFVDHDNVMREKCTHLANLLRRSKKTVVYSGAGISVAAGIGQAARGKAVGGKSTDALPTFTHYALGALSSHGLLHEWVQQNHDGLPQKAGFPQEKINEIHGSWYDPSNPVVKYSGNLKHDAFPRMIKSAETADLVLVLGTSLGGLNADQVATETARRSLNGHALGSVIINLQQVSGL